MKKTIIGFISLVALGVLLQFGLHAAQAHICGRG